jgi:SAM-dependent methyltransferase
VNGLPHFAKDFSTVADFLDWWLRHPVLAAPQQAVFDGYYAGYRERFGRYIRHHYSGQSAEIAALIRAKGSPRLLEIGGGCGTEALWFALQGARVLAIDVNEERLGVARARKEIIERGIGRMLEIEFRFCSLFNLDAPAAFDLIWMEQAFHHVEPREKIYSTIARLLASEGHVVISEANGWNPLLQLLLFRKRGFSTIVDRTAPDGQRILYGNERVTIPSVMARGFEDVGIEQNTVRYFRILPNMAAAESVMPLERAIPQFATPLFSHYNYVGRKPATTEVCR